MKIVFIGCVENSYHLLEELLENRFQVAGVCSKSESAYNADYMDLTPLCKEYELPIFYTNDINSADTLKFISSCEPDIIYCFGWSQLLKSDIIRIPPKGVVGYHPAALPKNRGRHPLIWALVLGLHETASTFFMINEGVDSGDIVAQEAIEICDNDDARALYSKVGEVARRQVVELTEQFIAGTVEFRSQNPAEGNTWRKRGVSDGCIDFRMSGKDIHNLVRGLTHPYVGAHFVFNGEEKKVWKSEVITDCGQYGNIEFGKVIEKISATSFLVKAGNDSLVKILECDPVDLKGGDYL
jgi:methionyl-tRNA formyltransferase